MKVHITLIPSVRSDPGKRQDVLQKLLSEADLSEVNLKRFERHGILSGEMPKEKLPVAEKMNAVQSVSPDGVKWALGKSPTRTTPSSPRKQLK